MQPRRAFVGGRPSYSSGLSVLTTHAAPAAKPRHGYVVTFLAAAGPAGHSLA